MSRYVNAERAGAFAKRALDLMTERAVPPTPDNFEIWFSYASGENPELARTIDVLLSNKREFDETVLLDLHMQFFAPHKAAEIVNEVGTKMSAEIDSLLANLESATKDADAYGQTLSHASGELSAQPAAAGIKTLVDSVIVATRAMEARTHALEGELQKSSREVTELRGKLETVRKESLTDQLTGLSNRKAFDAELRDAATHAMETGEALSLLMCDIDHFKAFNDTWGHQTGDQVLRLVASCLSENVKGRDTAARYGGEEFVVILPSTELDDAIRLANQLRLKVESKKLVKKSTGDILGTITMSTGIAIFDPGEPLAGFVQRADACLYAAKRSGRNCVVTETDDAYSSLAETEAA